MAIFKQIIDLSVADTIIKENAETHRLEDRKGYPDFVTLGYFGIWEIVARAEYSFIRKKFVYDGGIQIPNSCTCDRQDGYESLNELLESAIIKAQKKE